MPAKSFRINFYNGHIARGTEGPSTITEVLNELHPRMEDDRAYFPSHDTGNEVHQLRELNRYTNSNMYFGYFAKFRKNDLPHIASENAPEEQEIDLTEEEGLIEKNYFIFDPTYDLLIFQGNIQALNAMQLGTMFSHIIGRTVVFNPVLTRDAAQRVINNDFRAKKYELGFTIPSNASLYNGDDWSSSLFKLLSNQGAASCTMTVSANPVGQRNGRLSNSIKNWIASFTEDNTVRASKIWFEDSSDPIDLVTDRIKSKTQPIEMEGRYPSTRELFDEMRRIFNERLEEISEVLEARHD